MKEEKKSEKAEPEAAGVQITATANVQTEAVEDAGAAKAAAKEAGIHPQNQAFQEVMEMLYAQADNLNDIVKKCSYNIKWEVSINALVASRMMNGKVR